MGPSGLRVSTSSNFFYWDGLSQRGKKTVRVISSGLGAPAYRNLLGIITGLAIFNYRLWGRVLAFEMSVRCFLVSMVTACLFISFYSCTSSRRFSPSLCALLCCVCELFSQIIKINDIFSPPWIYHRSWSVFCGPRINYRVAGESGV